MSRRPEGRRGRSRKSDPAEETATWLLEMEQQADSEREDEEDWAQRLRTTRASGSTGQFPAVPVEGPAGAPFPNRTGAAAAPGAGAPPVGGAPSSVRPSVGQHSSGEAPPVHPPLAERYRSSASGTPPSAPQPPLTPTSDPAAAAWSWEPREPPAESWFGTQSGDYEPRSGAWEPGAQAQQSRAQAQQPRAPLDPQPGTSPPRHVDDPGPVPPPSEPQPWETAAESEPWAGAGAWPLDESTQSWEVDDRSWLWPTQEAPSSTGSWEVDPSALGGDLWRTEPGQPGETATPGYPAANRYPVAGGLGAGDSHSGSAGFAASGSYPRADDMRATGGYRPEGSPGNDDLADTGQFPTYGGTDSGFSAGSVGTDSAAAMGASPAAAGSPLAGAPWAGPLGATSGSGSGVGSMGAGPGPGGDAPGLGSEGRADRSDNSWYDNGGPRSYGTPSGELTNVLDEDEQVVRLGRAADDDPRGLRSTDAGRAQATRGTRTAEARRVQPTGEPNAQRSSWPRVVALISWVVLLMVLCWFYVFPWLERILPENF